MERRLPSPSAVPIADAETEAFWAAARERRLLIRHCSACGRNHFYPRRACPFCWRDDCEWRRASGNGRIFSYTIIHHNDAPPFRDLVPYIVALIELEEGVRLISSIVECTPEVVRVGMVVEAVFERWTDDITVPKFRPTAILT